MFVCILLPLLVGGVHGLWRCGQLSANNIGELSYIVVFDCSCNTQNSLLVNTSVSVYTGAM